MTRDVSAVSAEAIVHQEAPHRAYPWWKVLWLTGVDYFSTLGYQPAIAFLAAGALAPIATAFLVLVTIFCAFPVYSAVAKYSFAGQGSIAMLERLLSGWKGKMLVLVLLGFATTDFVITMTLSAADAAQHAVENPILHGLIGDHRMIITLALLALLAVVFLRGFHEAIGLAMFVAVPYMLLSGVVIARGLFEVATHPEAFARWREAAFMGGDIKRALALSVLVFPKLALGLSGFETGVSVMPLVENEGGGDPPAGRIRGTSRLLFSAAILMSFMLITSSLVTSVLIPAEELQHGGEAAGRALAWLAHHQLGHAFGTVYDAFTILILWFAGASAMAALLTLIPRYLPRFGMAPKWVERARLLVLVIFGIDVIVTLVFRANVEAQGGAYATGVLVLMLSAAIAVTLAYWQVTRWRAVIFGAIAVVFGYVLVENVLERPDGVIISSVFIVSVVTLSGLSRWRRSLELRVEKFSFADGASRELFEQMKGKKVHLIPLGGTRREQRREKAAEIKKHYKLEDAPLCFLHVLLIDDTSEFSTDVKIRVTHIQETGNYIVHVTGAPAIANTIAWISEQLDPISLFLDLRPQNPMAEALNYLLWGSGDVGMMVYRILTRHWQETPEEDIQPRIFLFSEE